MQQALRVRVGEPLAPHVPELIEHLVELGYSDRSVTEHLQRLRLLSRWLNRKGLAPSAIDEALVHHIVEAHHALAMRLKLRDQSFRLVVEFLRSRGIVPPPAPEPATPFDELLANYRRHLEVDRGLSPSTVTARIRTARRFLHSTCGDDPERVGELTAAGVASFVVDVSRRSGPSAVNNAAAESRSLLRWLHVNGQIDTPLAQAVPWLARRRRITPPRGVGADEIQALLDSCDRHRLAGLRDYAVLSLLARLGLRACETAAIELADINWRRAELSVRGKGGWRDPLPLPVDVGDALAAYLQRRGPAPGRRELFLAVRAPFGPLTVTNLHSIVSAACTRAGLPEIGTHRLRHGVAEAMLAKGAPLHEIGQVLRHRHLKTTAIYAAVDYASLAMVSRPWPGTQR